MRKTIGVICIFLCCVSFNVCAQSVRVSETLKELKMENIAVVQKPDTITVAFETSVHRGSYSGIGMAIRRLITIPGVPTLQMVILDQALPQLCVILPAELIENYQSGRCNLDDVYRRMKMSTSTKVAMRDLEGVKREDTTFGKVDIVLYPGVLLVNNLTYKLYRAAFEVQPALEMQLWQGASLRIQVCLPVINNEGGKWDCIRPGYLTLRQEFRFDNHWKGYFTGGNFSNDRQGLAARVGYFSTDGRWTVEGEGGITGSSRLYGSDWRMSKWKRINGRLGIGYYIPFINTQLKIDGGRYLYGDYGLRGTLSRYFGEHIVGVYAMYTDGAKNAGFHFSIPLPGKKRNRHAVRVMLPDDFSFQYDMRSGNEYAKHSLGESYSTEPRSAENTRFWQPDYIRYYLIRTNEKKHNSNDN